MTERRIETVRPAALYPAVPYAYATVAPEGALVMTAGACPIDVDGQVVGVGDVAAQAGRVVANLFAVLEDAGCSPADVLRTTVWVATADRADLLTAWAVVREAFGDWDPPSTLLGVTVLGFPDQLVEVEAVALREPPTP